MKVVKKLQSVRQQAWRAGIGVCDSGWEKATDKFDQFYVESNAFVNELLVRGESIETQLQAKLEARKMLQDKISNLRAKLGLGNTNRDQQIDALSQRVDGLIDIVAKLAQQKAAEKKTVESKVEVDKPAKKAPARSKTAAKTAETKPSTRKASLTKAPAKPRVRRVTSKKTDEAKKD